MPRMARLESPGSLFHIMSHAIDDKKLFIDEDDISDFLSRFEKGIKKTGFKCLGWALMGNHYHLVIRTNHLRLCKLMSPLNGGYAARYNKKYKRKGYLFRSRFKSVLCQDQDYAVQLIKYVHLNPLRAGMVKSLEELKDCPLCGHGFLIGKEDAPGEKFQSREEALCFFSDEKENAVSAYMESMSQSCNCEDIKTAGKMSETEITEIARSCKGSPAVIGDPEFVKNALEQYKKHLSRIHRKVDYPHVLKKISIEVCQEYDITESDLMKRGRKNKRSQARADFCYRSHVMELIPLSVIAEFLRVTISPIAVLVSKGTPEDTEDKTVTCVQTVCSS